MSARSLVEGTTETIARRLGSSNRTFTRWLSGESRPSNDQLLALAREVQPRDAALAAELAGRAGAKLPPLGGPAASVQGVPLTARHVADLVVFAAAQALDVSPSAMEPAVAAVVRRMKELGVDVDLLEAGLAAPPPAKRATNVARKARAT